MSPVSEPDDDVDPFGFKPCHLLGDWLQLVIDDEGARVGHLGGDDEKCVGVRQGDTSKVSGVR